MYIKALISFLVTLILCFPSANAIERQTVDITPKEFTEIVKKDSKSKYKFIFIFASWCGVCKKSFPDLVSLSNKYDKLGVEFIVVSIDNNIEKLENYISSQKLDKLQIYRFNYSNVYQLADSFRSINMNYKGAVPHTMLIDSNRAVIADGNYLISAFDKGLEMLVSKK